MCCAGPKRPESAASRSRPTPPEIAAVVKSHGGEAVMTRADHPSGSDRIYEALGKLDPGGRGRDRGQSAGRFSDHPARQYPRRAGAAGRSRGRYRDPGRGDPYRGGERQPERGEGGRLADRPAAAARALFHPRHGAPRATGRATITSGSMPIAARRWSASSGCRPRRWSCRRNWSSCGRWKPECGSTSTIVDTVPRGVDTPADLETPAASTGQNLSG